MFIAIMFIYGHKFVGLLVEIFCLRVTLFMVIKRLSPDNVTRASCSIAAV